MHGVYIQHHYHNYGQGAGTHQGYHGGGGQYHGHVGYHAGYQGNHHGWHAQGYGHGWHAHDGNSHGGWHRHHNSWQGAGDSHHMSRHEQRMHRLAEQARREMGAGTSGNEGFISPVAGVYPETSRFGSRTLDGHPDFHPGIDIGVPEGTSLRAVAGAKVVQAGPNGGYGNSVTLELPDHRRVIYGHLSEVDVRAGQSVEQGQKVGLSGNTGKSEGAHLHFEMRDANGGLINPQTALNSTGVFGGGAHYAAGSLVRPSSLPSGASSETAYGYGGNRR